MTATRERVLLKLQAARAAQLKSREREMAQWRSIERALFYCYSARGADREIERLTLRVCVSVQAVLLTLRVAQISRERGRFPLLRRSIFPRGEKEKRRIGVPHVCASWLTVRFRDEGFQGNDASQLIFIGF